MAEESEKRFHAVMDKLFHAPSPPNSNSRSSRTTDSTSGLSGRKRPHIMTTSLALVDSKSKGGMVEELTNAAGVSVEAPMCRPWDRGDLLKRLATFKSMTWFAKPEVVSAINCARRGWVNIDMDIIACESCGARLLFSTPSSWAQKQVEKAALVFSLKLNSGHKLLCPWVDNACDEKLAQFPPTSPVDLVDNYKKRYTSILHLSALPVISSSAIDYMRSPQLEHFLNSTSTHKHVYGSDNISAREYPGDECEEILYYQAQKLISLCGWEPRLLPYIVDCKNLHDQSSRDGAHHDPSVALSNAATPNISVYSSGTTENAEANEDSAAFKQYDYASVVLDCRLCGASVGLWTFSTTPRPLEFIRFTGHSEIDEKNSTGREMDIINQSHNSIGVSGFHTERREETAKLPSNRMPLSLTIAGGPPPAEQNFRPTISLPVVGQNLRTRFSSAFESSDGDHQPYMELSQSNKKEHSSNALIRKKSPAENITLIQGKTHEDAGAHCSSTSESVEAAEDDNGIMKTEIPAPSKPLESSDGIIQSSSTDNRLSEDLKSIEAVNPVAGDLCSSDVEASYLKNHGAEKSTVNYTSSLNNVSEIDVAVQNSGSGKKCDKQINSLNRGVETAVQSLSSSPSCFGKNSEQVSAAKAMEFDPIRQHRHFCPWITSSGKSAPGWKQTLSALERQKEFSYQSPPNQASSSLIEVDDPVGSVKKLLTPPSAKRKKLTHGLS